MQNQINVALTTQQLGQVDTGLTAVEQVISGIAIAMTPQQRVAFPKIAVDNKVQVERAINVCTQPAAANILPPFLKPELMQTDLKLYEQLLELEQRVKGLLGMITETKILAGSEAYQGALIVKRLVDSAAAAGVSGAKELADILAERYEGQGRLRDEGDDNAGGSNNNPAPDNVA